VETLAAKTPGEIEGALAIARAAIDASEFGKARSALAPFVGNPTQRVAMLMAEIERTEHGDSGKARAWTLRAVRARLDRAWTADGYVSDRWRPVSPVTGRLDAFQWQAPLASLPSDKGSTIESSPFEDAMLAAPSPPREVQSAGLVEPPREEPVDAAAPATQDNTPPPAKVSEPAAPAEAPTSSAAPEPEPASESHSTAAPAAPAAPLFRTRADLAKPATAPIPPVIPILRPPDDPGIDEEGASDEFVEQIGTPKAQAGGWRGFWARWGGA
jgi:HemY protein